MKEIKLLPQDLEKFDVYIQQWADIKLARAFERAHEAQSQKWRDKFRLSPEKQAVNDARIKQFMADVAAGAPYTKPIITNLWASLGTISAPTSDQQLEGWGITTPPESYFFNWFYNTVETYLGHINQYGICVWDNQTDYPIGGVAQGSDGKLYYSIVSPNINHNPVGDNHTHWIPYFTAKSAQVSSTVAQNSGVLSWDNAVYNPFNWWAASPNPSRITPTIPGRYDICCTIGTASTVTANKQVVLQALKNGVNPGQVTGLDNRFVTTGNFSYFSGTTQMTANGTTDYFEVDVQQSATSDQFGPPGGPAWLTVTWRGF